MKGQSKPVESQLVLWFEEVCNQDVALVGGKNASLGEMIQQLSGAGILVPQGFALTAHAYRTYLEHNDLNGFIEEQYGLLAENRIALADVTRRVRRTFLEGEFPDQLRAEVAEAYRELSRRYDEKEADVAVRSSATAEDLPDASFAGQQETFLHVSGEDDLIYTCKRCFASLFTERAISYREQKGFDHLAVALSVGVQKMVRSDSGVSGVMFTLDTETGFPDVIVINAAYGLGETVVQGIVTPDEYRVFKPALDDPGKVPLLEKILGTKEIRMIYGEKWSSRVKTVNTAFLDRRRFALNDSQILQLARWAKTIEDHYGHPMDIEWALDGETNEMFVVQARPETVQSQIGSAAFKTARLLTEDPHVVVEGQAIGSSIASGEVAILKSLADGAHFKEGQIPVASMTDPDWVPLMKKAAGIVTDHGGRTSHAAIVSRELGVPAVIGTGHATKDLYEGQEVTLSCAEGEHGFVYRGLLDFEEEEIQLEGIPETRTDLMLNIASPEAAMHWWKLPAAGIGLARMEFIISNLIKIHPMALVKFDELDDIDVNLKRKIRDLTDHYATPADFFVDNLAMGIAYIAASRFPKPVIVRMSDFKTNEYAKLVGGNCFEPKEENPMIGFRRASRYYHPDYREGFELECRAVKKAREEIGLTNIIVMIPFCRTIDEADKVLEVMDSCGLKRGEDGLQVYVMAEIPSNIILASEFAKRFDGFSIGSNDLTQLVLGIDRDSEQLAEVFDERNPAVTKMIEMLIESAHAAGCKVGICGQGPSDHPDFAEFLVKAGIDSISLTPDRIIPTTRRIAELEAGG
ncbi:MAG: pyruvate,water dikinase [Verrucomicrobiales bacterium]|jgi:pyruvate,water dikinase